MESATEPLLEKKTHSKRHHETDVQTRTQKHESVSPERNGILKKLNDDAHKIKDGIVNWVSEAIKKRGENLDHLTDKVNDLEKGSKQFEPLTNGVRTKYDSQKNAILIMICATFILIVLTIIIVICFS